MQRFKLELTLNSVKNYIQGCDWIEEKLLENPKVRELTHPNGKSLTGHTTRFLYLITSERSFSEVEQGLKAYIPSIFSYKLHKEPSFLGTFDASTMRKTH